MDFPRELDAVPADARITEALGVTPISFAAGCGIALLGAIVGLVQLGYHGISDLYIAMGCLAGLALFFPYEVWRRVTRYTLAFKGHQVGIYRRGKLESVLTRNQVGHYRLSILNTIREQFAFGAIALAALFGTAMIFQQLMFGLFALGALVALGGGFLSSIYIRWMCHHVILSPDQTQLAFAKGELAKVGMAP